MASKFYTDCNGHLINPRSGTKVLCWGALLGYINAVRLHNGLEALHPYTSWFKSGTNEFWSATGGTSFSNIVGSKNAIPSHGVAFYISSAYFDEFICSEINENELNSYYDILLSDENCYPSNFSVTYPVLIYSLADFATLFNMLVTTTLPIYNWIEYSTNMSNINKQFKNQRVNI